MIRTYIGNDFVVHEHLFVPLDEPGGVLTYEVKGRPVEVRVSFEPTLNLMWPASVGGQSVGWSDALHGYTLTESTDHYSAVVASPEAVAHTEPGNRTLRESLEQTLDLRPDKSGNAELFFSLDSPTSAAGAALQKLESTAEKLATEARQHYRDLLANQVVLIDTPDPEVNRALAWSEVALDQAWVCNPQLGCGLVAGYGPSRGTRRPQYAWFFAGDGLVAMQALLAAGEYSRARDELAFILKYQNTANGMIWHELSQSAGFLDWAGKYPYMFVHVDITFDFLSGVEQYFQATGDRAFLKQHWNDIRRAYRYCVTTLDPATGLPLIPAGKEGADEQMPMRESTALSSAWVEASAAYAAMARGVGESADANDAESRSGQARRALGAQVWDSKLHFWTAGHKADGSPVDDRRSGPAALLTEDVLTGAELNAAMDQLAMVKYQTDWGMRSLPEGASGYSPDSYSKGSVSALATSLMAAAFWQQHRPLAALQMWRALLPWFDVDAPGHMHEVLTGDYFHQQEESVPEQTWSSAGFLTASVQGLLGVEVNAPNRHLTWKPHLPAQWQHVAIDNLSVAGARLGLTLERNANEVDVTVRNSGQALDFSFAPELPLGATKLLAKVNGTPTKVRLLPSPGETQAQIAMRLGPGETHVLLRYAGGVDFLLPPDTPGPGDASACLRLTKVSMDGDALTLNASVREPSHASLEIRTPWKILGVEGAMAAATGKNLSRITFAGVKPGVYTDVRARIIFATP